MPEAAGLFPRRFLFAAFGLKAKRAARESRHVEIALRSDALEFQHRPQPVR